jgi:hypothetical protein
LPVTPGAPIPRTSADKVRLFRSLFRGREDIFPTRFVSAKTGKSGYAPACRNKFVRGVCELPKVKCGDCPSQAFIPFDDPAVVGHLTGRHVMGIYPILEDETCWFQHLICMDTQDRYSTLQTRPMSLIDLAHLLTDALQPKRITAAITIWCRGTTM